jgi:hypothetical protein
MNQTKDRGDLLTKIANADTSDAHATARLLEQVRQHLQAEQDLADKIHHLLFGDYER